jgi:hypothetical protein
VRQIADELVKEPVDDKKRPLLPFQAVFGTDRLVQAWELLVGRRSRIGEDSLHVGVAFHVKRILIVIEMRVLMGIYPPGMTQHVLRDFDAGDPVQVRCGRMPKKARVKVFFDPRPIGGFAEDVLQSPLRDALAAF